MKEQPEGGFLLDKIHHLARRSFAEKLRQHGIYELNAAQGRIMFVLWRAGSMPIQDLAKATGLGKSTLTSMLDRLEEAGHITRMPSPEDRRQIMVAASSQSIEHMERYVQVSKDMNELFYRGFAPGEINDFEAFLHRILANLSGSR